MEPTDQNGNGQKHRRNTAGLRPPWPKGVSGNPGGRPKGRTLYSAITEELDKDNGKGRTAAAKSYVRQMKRGSHNHAKTLMDREEGTVADGSNVHIVIVYADPRDTADDEAPARGAASRN